MKIILFYSSIGQGHISAARAIEQEILKKDSSALVIMKDIRDFMDPLRRKLDEQIYWFVAKNLPDLFDSLFISMQEQGNKAGSLAWLPNDYPDQKVLEYLKAETPDAVLATHYGSAQVLGTLREKGCIPDIKIGWLHTDYFEGYFPRISKRIDRTFLAHPELENRWLAAGVHPELVETTGMPVSIPEEAPDVSKECLVKIGLDPAVRTITIAGGKEGAADFAAVVMNIACKMEEPLQIIAVCGLNENQQLALEKISLNIPYLVKLKILGFIPQADLVSYIRASDIYITKAGGLSPAEAFTIGKPTILLNVISGHERENAELFSRLGMAEFNRDLTTVGDQVQNILLDQEKQASMLTAQLTFRDNMDIGKIACFLLDPQIKARCSHSNFGLENGLGANNVNKALEQLETDAPSDIEILLSYSSSIENERIVMENPFGHIAIRIGDTVYSANHISNPTKDAPLLQHMSLKEYLFGIHPPCGDQIHTSTYGMSYGRDTLGLRVKGVTPASMRRMHEDATQIEEEFRSGKCKWNKYLSNCADFVVRILCKGGFDVEYVKGPYSIITMPLDVFERACVVLEVKSKYRTELVAYRRLPGSQASYRFSRFPLSLGQPVRALKQVLTDPTPDMIERKICRQLTGYMGDEQIHYENLCARSSASMKDDSEAPHVQAKGLEHILLDEALELVAKRTSGVIESYKEQIVLYVMQELRSLIELCSGTGQVESVEEDKPVFRNLEERIKRGFNIIRQPLNAAKTFSVMNLSDHDRMPDHKDKKSKHIFTA